jgi:DNA polymerase-3 subunit epsilon
VAVVEGTLSLFDWRPAPAPAPERPSPREQAPREQAPREQAARDLAAVEQAAPEQAAAEAAPRDPALPEAALATGSGPTAAAAAAIAAARIVIFDCETTGTDRLQDQIIELCIQHGLNDDALNQTWRIKPTVPIHPGAQAVHGITMADLEGCPAFIELADAIVAVFAEADVIVGYNIAFDIEMLQAELARAGRSPLDLQGKQIVDAFRLWQQCEPRSLQHAHQRFVGNGFAAAHSASADVAATGRVLAGMLRAFNLDGQDWTSIANVCDPGRASWVGPSRHLRWENEAIVFGFGKHAGTPILDIAAGPDRSFLRWMLDRPPGRDFPPHVVEVCRAALDLPPAEFLQWARRRYGTAAPTAQPPFAK